MKYVATALGLAVMALASCDGYNDRAQQTVSSPDVPVRDGRWAVVAIDGRQPARTDLWVEVAAGAIVGGFDGCNNWGFEVIDGKRAVVSNAQGCSLTPDLAAYQELSRTEGDATRLQMDGADLVLTGQQHSFRARKR